MRGQRATYDQFRTPILTQVEVTVSRLKSISNFLQYINLASHIFGTSLIIAMVSQHCEGVKEENGCNQNQKKKVMTELHLISLLLPSAQLPSSCLTQSESDHLTHQSDYKVRGFYDESL